MVHVIALQELMIVYRKTPSHNWLSEVRDAIMGDMGKQGAGGQLRRRSHIAIRLYRDIPVPTWRIVFPDKLLQFRPLDGLRADLFSMAGGGVCCSCPSPGSGTPA